MAGYGFFVSQDQKETTRYIPMVGQGGLGLPDRDYYLKDDAKSKEIREKYVVHMAKMLELLGDTAEAARIARDNWRRFAGDAGAISALGSLMHSVGQSGEAETMYE